MKTEKLTGRWKLTSIKHEKGRIENQNHAKPRTWLPQESCFWSGSELGGFMLEVDQKLKYEEKNQIGQPIEAAHGTKMLDAFTINKNMEEVTLHEYKSRDLLTGQAHLLNNNEDYDFELRNKKNGDSVLKDQAKLIGDSLIREILLVSDGTYFDKLRLEYEKE